MNLVNKIAIIFNSVISSALIYGLIYSIQYLIEFGGWGAVILFSVYGLIILALAFIVFGYAIFSLIQNYNLLKENNKRFPFLLNVLLIVFAFILPKVTYNFEINLVKKHSSELSEIVELAKAKKLSHNNKYQYRQEACQIPSKYSKLSKYDCFVWTKPVFTFEISPRNPYLTVFYIEDTSKWNHRNDEIFHKRIKENWYLVKYDFN